MQFLYIKNGSALTEPKVSKYNIENYYFDQKERKKMEWGGNSCFRICVRTTKCAF